MNALRSVENISNTKPITPKDSANAFILKRKIARKKRQYSNSYIEQGIEISIKIIINGLLTYVAFTALTKLLPYQKLQQQKLAEIHHEVKETEARVAKIREKFTHNFDPTQTKKIMEKNSHKIDPNVSRIIFIKHNSD